MRVSSLYLLLDNLIGLPPPPLPSAQFREIERGIRGEGARAEEGERRGKERDVMNTMSYLIVVY